MRGLARLVDHYLTEWGSREWAPAYHSLIELGPQILPLLAERFEDSANPAFRADLVQLARQLRTEEALPLFASALRDPAPAVWKEALDGLVALASESAVALLREGLEAEPPGEVEPAEWAAWLGEALGQALQTQAARGGAA